MLDTFIVSMNVKRSLYVSWFDTECKTFLVNISFRNVGIGQWYPLGGILKNKILNVMNQLLIWLRRNITYMYTVYVESIYSVLVKSSKYDIIIDCIDLAIAIYHIIYIHVFKKNFWWFILYLYVHVLLVMTYI